jgi:hypothetical protein
MVNTDRPVSKQRKVSVIQQEHMAFTPENGEKPKRGKKMDRRTGCSMGERWIEEPVTVSLIWCSSIPNSIKI